MHLLTVLSSIADSGLCDL